jgi:hypothetical protein
LSNTICGGRGAIKEAKEVRRLDVELMIVVVGVITLVLAILLIVLLGPF